MKSRNNILFWAVAVATLALTACVKDPVIIQKLDSNKLQIAFTIPDQVPGSYATVGALPLEREFDEAYVLFYDAAGGYVAHSSSHVQSSSSVGSFEVIKPAAVETEKAYKMLVVANLKHYLDPKYTSTSDYIEANKALKYTVMESEMKAMSNKRIARNLPMYAKTDATLSSPSVISVVFERAVARIDLVSMENDLDIEWVKVCNYNNGGYLFHHEYNAAGSAIINGGGAGEVEENPQKVLLTRRSEMSDPTASQSNTDGGLYAFPNINVNTGVNDQKTTCLLIKGTYSYENTSGATLTKEAYYRVNVCMPGKPQNLKRNNIYRITVKSVSDGGADNEDDAMKNPTINVDYEINDWQVDNSQEIITDANGNFLVVSPTSAYIGGTKGSSLTGGIKVKSGSSWTIEKVAPAASWFTVTKTKDNTGFVLTAASDNTSTTILSSKALVKVTGTMIEHEIYVYQYYQKDPDDQVLIIDGKMGDFTLDVNGNGQTIKLQALLGTPSAGAAMNYFGGDGTMIQSSNPALGGVNAIGYNSTISLEFSANPKTTERSSMYKIVRKQTGKPDITLTITFTQPPATEIIVPSPKVIFTENSVDGFLNLIGAAQIKKCKYQRVYVSSLNTVTYPKWKATSSFNTYDVALIANSTTNSDIYPEGPNLKNTAIGSSGEYFDIAIARCGPGDGPLLGSITIEACNSSGSVSPTYPKYTIPLTVYSSLNSGFTMLGGKTWHDRNVGTRESEIGDESKITLEALPFSNDTRDYQSNEKVGNYYTYRNRSFRGSYHTFYEANRDSDGASASPLCPPGWRIPNPTELTALVNAMQWAKAGSRPYIVANAGTNLNKVGCYFNMAGMGGEPKPTVYSYYWSNSYNSNYGDWYCFMMIDSTNAGCYEGRDSGTRDYNQRMSIRCIK